MPVYNTGNILHNTISSILNQTYTDWFLYLVDDGSTDGSAQVCDAYANIDERIKVFHKQNGGISDARNYVLDRITTPYVAFCDHDDDYHPDLLSKAMRSIVNSKYDIVCYRYKIIFDDGTIKDSCSASDAEEYSVNFRSDFMRMYEKGLFHTVWSKIYRLDYLTANKAKFDATFKYGGEDIDFNLNLISNDCKALYINDFLYTHYIRGSLSTSARIHIENANLFNRQLDKYHSVIDRLGIDVNLYKEYYLGIFISLYHLCSAYQPRLNINHYEKKKRLREFSSKDKTAAKIKNVVAIHAPFDKMLYCLHALGLYSVIIAIFNIKYRITK